MASEKTSTSQALRWLFRQARGAKMWIGLSVGLGFCSGFLLILQAGLLARIIHAVAIDGLHLKSLQPLFAGIVLIVAIRSGLAWAREISGFHAGARICAEIRRMIMAHIFRLGPSYVDGRQTGELASAVMEHVEGLHGFFALYLPQLALAVMLPIAVLVFVFPISWAAGGLLLFTAPLIPLFMVLIGMGAESVSQRHYQALSRMSGYFLDILRGLPTLKLFGQSRQEQQKVAKVSGRYRRRTMNVLKIAFLSAAVMEFFSSVAIALVAVFLGMTYLGYYHFGTWDQPLSLSAGFFILLLAPDFYLPLRELASHYHVRAEAAGAAEAIIKVLNTTPVQSTGPKFKRGINPPLDIHCQNLHLAYDRRKDAALSGVSFALKAQERVAILGQSGAGKTTLLNLIMGFIQPDQGSILVNGTALTDLTIKDWRQQIAWVGQQPVLFQGSIKENILMGNPAATPQEIGNAVKAARVVEFVDALPEGLETRIGEQGHGLSRGQGQRVALARAFLKNAPLVLLDEPTASLDLENERLVMAAIDRLARGRTVCIATHRLLHLEKADRIIVMSQGEIMAQGRLPELAATLGQWTGLMNKGLKKCPQA